MRAGNIFQLSILATVLALVFFQGCATIYVPNASHTHLMNEKGELSTTVYSGTNGFDLQAGYAVSDKIAVLGAGSFGSSNDDSETSDHEHTYGELGIEYFKAFKNIGRFELIAGAGLGSAEGSSEFTVNGTTTEVLAKGDYNRIFLQSNIGIENKYVDFGTAIRLAQVTFNNLEGSSTVYEDSESATFFEPMVFLNIGWDHIKLVSQIGISAPLQDDVAFQHEPFFLSVGLKGNWNIGK